MTILILAWLLATGSAHAHSVSCPSLAQVQATQPNTLMASGDHANSTTGSNIQGHAMSAPESSFEQLVRVAVALVLVVLLLGHGRFADSDGESL